MEDENLVSQLKERGLSCSKLAKMEKNQREDAKRDLKDAKLFRSLGFSNQAEKQESIAKAQESSAEAIKSLRLRVCLLK